MPSRTTVLRRTVMIRGSLFATKGNGSWGNRRNDEWCPSAGQVGGQPQRPQVRGRQPRRPPNGGARHRVAFVVDLRTAGDEDCPRGGLAGVKVEDVKIDSKVSPDPSPTAHCPHDSSGKLQSSEWPSPRLRALPGWDVDVRRRRRHPVFGAPLMGEPLGSVAACRFGAVAVLRARASLADGLRIHPVGAGTVASCVFRNHRGRWMDWTAHRRKVVRIIAAVFVATSTLLVEKSLNARPYEISAFLVALCALMLLRWLDDSRTRWLWAFSVLALLAAAMQLFSVLAPAACCCPFWLCVRNSSLDAFVPCSRPLLSSRWSRRVVCHLHAAGGPSELDRQRIYPESAPAEIRDPYRSALPLCLDRHPGSRRDQAGRHVESVVSALSSLMGCVGIGMSSRDYRLGDPAHTGSVPRLIRPSNLFSAIRVRIGTRSCLTIAFICVRTFPEVLGSARVRRRTTNGKLAT